MAAVETADVKDLTDWMSETIEDRVRALVGSVTCKRPQLKDVEGCKALFFSENNIYIYPKADSGLYCSTSLHPPIFANIPRFTAFLALLGFGNGRGFVWRPAMGYNLPTQSDRCPRLRAQALEQLTLEFQKLLYS